jgi:hypothetical protein
MKQNTSKVRITTDNEDQLYLEAIFLLREIKNQLRFKQGKEAGTNTLYAIIETALK